LKYACIAGIFIHPWQYLRSSFSRDAAEYISYVIAGSMSEYKYIFAVSRNDPSRPFMPDAAVHNAYNDNHSAVTATGVPDLVFWFLFMKTSLTRTPSCPRFTEDDANALIEEFATVAPGLGYTIKDLWDA
jgi:hypothetical protein